MSFSSRRNDWKGGLLPEFFLSAGCDQHSYAPAWLSRKTCRKFGEGPPNYDAKGRNNHQMPLRKWDSRLTISNHFKPFRTISNNLFFSMFFPYSLAFPRLDLTWISEAIQARRFALGLWAAGIFRQWAMWGRHVRGTTATPQTCAPAGDGFRGFKVAKMGRGVVWGKLPSGND